MIVNDFLQEINDALRATDDDVPTVGTEEASYWLRIAKRLRRNLYNDPTKRWRSTYKETPPNEPGTVATTGSTTLTGTNTYFLDYQVGDKITVDGETVRTIATITSNTVLTVTVAFDNTDSGLTFTRQIIITTGVTAYNLHRDFIGPSDTFYVIDTDDNRHYFDIIKPEERKQNTQQVFISDVNPKILNFADAIESTDNIVGGVLTLPAYYQPSDFSAGTDIIDVDDPDWLVIATAAKVASADLTYEDRAPDLSAEANALNAQMFAKNRRGTYGNPQTTTHKVTRITSPDRR